MPVRAKGFTLIELLVVILIISIIVGIAVVIPRSSNMHAQVKDEAVRLAFLFNTASEQALLSNNELGLSLNNNQYNWWQWDKDNEQWVELNKSNWHDYRLPEAVTLSAKSAEIDHLPDTIKGLIAIFYSDGSTTPATFVFSEKENQSYQLVLATDGVAPLDER